MRNRSLSRRSKWVGSRPMLRTSRSIHSSGRELAAAFPVLFEVEGGQLDRLEAVDPERTPLAGCLLVVLVPDLDLRPDAAHE